MPDNRDPGPFTVFNFTQFKRECASVMLDGETFVGDTSPRGARKMAQLLNDAVALADDPAAVCIHAADRPDYARERVAFAVAKALGGMIDFGSFSKPVADSLPKAVI